MRNFLLAVSLSLICVPAVAQKNISCTNVEADNVIHGSYDPDKYKATSVISDPHDIINGMVKEISADSLKKYVIRLSEFQNRNTGSDTLSNTIGIGAARRWAYGKFREFGQSRENRLIPSYLYFEQDICAMDKHKNILAVLPGTDKSKPVIIIEGHIDSRCDEGCDISCKAQGVEDNASGSALVLEMARVMSIFTYTHTMVFMLTIGEEQGLMGANAFATWAKAEKINIKAVYNNDVIGGIICGKTSSEPSCPSLNDIDSTNVRIFSAGVFNSAHKGLARFTKLEYNEEVRPGARVPMNIHIMTPEDRTGRGGDHIPFSAKGFTAIRFTSANEHGDASNSTGYDDRQHTSNDILGIDTDGDKIVDSFFVDFNYLARNAVINGTSASMVSQGPQDVPTFSLQSATQNVLEISITDPKNYDHYRIGIRSSSFEWDSVYTLKGAKTMTITAPGAQFHFVSVAVVDDKGIESLFSEEKYVKGVAGLADNTPAEYQGIALLQNKPNPYDEATAIGIVSDHQLSSNVMSYLSITDMQGREIEKIPVYIHQGLNEIIFHHGRGKTGVYAYTLYINGKAVGTRRMVFAN